jgi:hypothetical protein
MRERGPEFNRAAVCTMRSATVSVLGMRALDKETRDRRLSGGQGGMRRLYHIETHVYLEFENKLIGRKDCHS